MTLDHLREIALIQISQAQRTNAMTLHTLKQMNALYKPMNSTRDIVDQKHTVCVLFDDRKSAVCRFRTVVVDDEGNRVRDKGAYDLDEVLAYADAEIERLRSALMQTAA
jgi:hypothetical protein